MELLSENLSIAPGEPFYVGWRIRRDEGWHTYWKHPGDVGVPPALKWEVPAGFQAGELCFPPPQRIKMASVAAHGHKGETLFLTQIVPPSDLPLGAKITLHAKASWLTCSRQCCPGFRDLSLELPVQRQARIDPNAGQRFDVARGTWPRSLEGWTIAALDKGRRIILRLDPPPAKDSEVAPPLPSKPYFFGEGRLVRSNKPQVVKRKGGGLQIRLTRAEWAPEGAEILTGLVYAEEGWGGTNSPRYARIVAPLEKFDKLDDFPQEP